MAEELVVKHARLGEVLAAIAAQLVALVPGLVGARVRTLVKGPEVPRLDGDFDVLLVVGGWRGESSERDRHHRRVFRRLTVIVRFRSELDEVASDHLWLTRGGGAADLEESLSEALQNFWPADADGNQLTFQPLDVGGTLDPERHPKDRGWGQVGISTELPLLLRLTTTGTLENW
jgi:hypothetical protein